MCTARPGADPARRNIGNPSLNASMRTICGWQTVGPVAKLPPASPGSGAPTWGYSWVVITILVCPGRHMKLDGAERSLFGSRTSGIITYSLTHLAASLISG
jgi:hypothetical protein